MKFKKQSFREMSSFCDEIGADDGVDPRSFFGSGSRKKTNRKALQLCGEIARTLSAVLAWESGDELLSRLTVESVAPAPDSTRVLVTMWLEGAAEPADVSLVLQRLQRASGKLRAEIATAIHRKRVPELAFQVFTRGEARP
jgi:ribosome-binding factor A